MKLLILIISFFILVPAFAITNTQIAVGTYVVHDNIQQPMLIINEQNSWSFINTIPHVENGGYLYAVNCTEKNCIATGAIETTPYYWPSDFRRPLFMMSSNQGKSWAVINNISNLPSMEDGIAPALSCKDNRCTAVGWYQSSTGPTLPLLLVSADSGESWSTMQNIAHLPAMKEGELSTVTCKENFCIAGGTFNIQHDDDQVFFLLSQDNGQSWSASPNIAGLPKMEIANLQAIKCNHHFCIAAGHYRTHDDDAHALLLVSQDQGQSWKLVKEIPELANLQDLHIEDLTYTSGSFIVVGGYRKDEGFLQSLILVSNDNGQSWSLIKDIAGSHAKKLGWLRSISCTDNICVAGGDGFYLGGASFGLTLLISKDSGQSWSVIPYVTGTTYTPDIDVVQCHDNVCVAIGNFTDNTDYSHPTLLVSNDKGQSWSGTKDITNLPQNIYNIHFSSTTTI